MTAAENSLHHRLRTNEIDLSAVCRRFEIDEQTSQGDPYAHLVTVLTDQNRLPELYAYLESRYPDIQWQAPQREISIQAGRTVEIAGDVVGGDKIGGDKITYHGLSVEEVATLMVELKNENQPTVWNGRIPYLGLNAFQESDAEFFFGRETLIDELLERVAQSNFITIAGPSGSGKSSLARAGLFHALRHGRIDRSDHWLLATMTPGHNPLEQLARAVEYATQAPAIGDALREEPEAFGRYAEIGLREDKRRRFVLLVDQFEETFTQTKDAAHRAKFIRLLTEAAQTDNSRLKIVVAIRSDFISACAAYPQLRAQINAQFQLVGAMEPRELAKAITLPALAVGAEIDPALVSRIIADMKGEPGALPLMSFALRDLFTGLKNRPGEKVALTLEAYTHRGGLEHALERHAEQAFADFTPEQRRLAKNIFTKLVEVDQGRVDTRRTAAFAELVPATATPAATRQVVEALAGEGARLITTSGQLDEDAIDTVTVTIAHERLIDAWPWLRQLVDENRELIALRNQISHDARAWAEEKDDGFLYRGGRLLQIEERLDELMPHLGSLSIEFIRAAIHLRQAEEQRREEQRQRELAQQQALAAEQAKRAKEAEARGQAETEARQQAQMRAAEAEQSSQQLRRRRNLAFGLAGTAAFLAIMAFILFNNAQESAIEAQTLGTAEAIARATSDWNANVASTNVAVAQTEEANAFAEATRAVAAQQTAEASESIADRQRTIANTRSMLALSTALISDKASPSITQTEQSLLMAVQAVRTNEVLNANIDPALIDTQLRNMLDRNYRIPWTTQLQGHTSSVRSVAFSPDGETLASASEDRTIRLWNLDDPRAEATILQGHTDRVPSAAFSPDGQILASASEDQTVRLWNLDAPQAEPTILQGHSSGVLSVAFSPDGQTLASASEDRTIRLWNLNDLQAEPTVLQDHTDVVWSVAFSPDGETLASAGADQTVRLWNLDNLQAEPTILQDHTDVVFSVAFSSNGERLASAGADQTIRLWNLNNSQTEPSILQGHTNWVLSVAFSPDGKTLASSSDDQTMRLWDLDDPQAKPIIIRGHTNWVFSVAFSPDGKTLASASVDNTLRLWNLINPQAEPAIIRSDDSLAFSIAFSPNAETLASAGSDQTVHLQNLSNSSASPTILDSHTDFVNSVAFDHEGQMLASASDDQTVRLWNLSALETGPTILQGHTDAVRSVVFAPDGQTLASAGDDQTIRLWHLNNLEAQPIILRDHTDSVLSIAFSPDGETLASASGDQTVRLWNLNDLQPEPIILQGHTDRISAVAFSPDGQILASASDDQTIRLWDLTNLQEESTILQGHTNWVFSVAFSPDGETLASASGDQTVRLWKLAALQVEPIILQRHDLWVMSVAFSPDGETLASAGADQMIRLWPTTDRLVNIACEYAGRNMSWEEWQEYLPTLPYERTCPQYPPHPSVPEEEQT